MPLTAVPSSPGNTTAGKDTGHSASSTGRFLLYGRGGPEYVNIYTTLGMILLLGQILLKRS